MKNRIEKKIVEQILAHVAAIEDNLLWEAPNFIGNFLDKEEEAQVEFGDKHGSLVAAAIPPLQISKKLLKEISKKVFLDETPTRSYVEELEMERELLEPF